MKKVRMIKIKTIRLHFHFLHLRRTLHINRHETHHILLGKGSVSSRTQSKTKSNTTTATKSREIGKKETNRDELLRYMKNYRNRFHFGNVLGSVRSGNVFP